MSLNLILDEVRTERARQDQMWGGPEHDDTHNSHDWITYIVKHLGKAIPSYVPGTDKWEPRTWRYQMIKVAALAVAAVEWRDRNWP